MSSQILFVAVIFFAIVEGGIIQPREVSNVPEGQGNVESGMTKILDMLNSSLAKLNGEGEGRAKRQLGFGRESSEEKEEEIKGKAWTMHKLLEHREMFEKCKTLFNEVEKFVKNAIQAKKDGFFSTAWFLAKNGLFSNKIAEFEESANKVEKICLLSLVPLDEASESGQYSELVELAEAKVEKDLKRMATIMNEIMKEIKA